jgi:hypothetical protein
LSVDKWNVTSHCGCGDLRIGSCVRNRDGDRRPHRYLFDRVDELAEIALRRRRSDIVRPDGEDHQECAVRGEQADGKSLRFLDGLAADGGLTTGRPQSFLGNGAISVTLSPSTTIGAGASARAALMMNSRTLA